MAPGTVQPTHKATKGTRTDVRVYTKLVNFTAHAIAVYAVVVCLSVCLSQVGVY